MKEETPQENEGRTEVFSIPDTKCSFELEPEAIRNLGRISLILERMRLSDYVMYMTKPVNVLTMNFFAGLARGLGFGLGMTVLLGVATYALGRMVDLPLIGEYVAKVVKIVHEEIGSTPPPPAP